MTSVFFSYSHADEDLRDTLEKHLAALKHQGFIDTWHDRRIDVGDVLGEEIESALEAAEVILLLVSPDFLASEYCYNIEMKRALERHDRKEARVIPVILKPCDWKDTPFGKLLATPKDAKPITMWTNLDEAFLDIVTSIKRGLPKEQNNNEQHNKLSSPPEAINSTSRSSNLRVRKNFTDEDKDKFLEDGFSYVEKFFENSLIEFEKRNTGYSTKFRRIDANKFTANIYCDGKDVSQCKIELGNGMYGNGISYSNNAQANSSSCNESMSVSNNDQNLFFEPIGMGFNRQNGEQLSFEGAAEYFWSMLLQPIQE